MNILNFARASFAVVALSVASAGWAFDIDVNADGYMDLTKVKGIGGYSAHRIILERETKGKYQDWAEFFKRLPYFIIGNVDRIPESQTKLNLDGQSYSSYLSKSS